LRAAAKITISLSPPDQDAVVVRTTGHEPNLGPDDAAVTIVEFGDYQCPFCRSLHRSLMLTLVKHAGTVRIVYKHLPLSFHSVARFAAEAAACAQKQGRFWQVHDALFTASSLNRDEVIRIVHANVADALATDTCLTERSTSPQIEEDVIEAARLGIDGTPTVIIGGKLIVGYLEPAALDQVINSALTRHQ
jgi:protein-disulfide isomerase